jgi:hypothetical protein
MLLRGFAQIIRNAETRISSERCGAGCEDDLASICTEFFRDSSHLVSFLQQLEKGNGYQIARVNVCVELSVPFIDSEAVKEVLLQGR